MLSNPGLKTFWDTVRNYLKGLTQDFAKQKEVTIMGEGGKKKILEKFTLGFEREIAQWLRPLPCTKLYIVCVWEGTHMFNYWVLQ